MSYTRVNWENLPSTNTPVNATNLNKMDAGIKDLDDNKVNETGDTLTGPLRFENKDAFGAVYKTRTISDVDYYASFGVGIYSNNQGAATIENNTGGNLVGRLEVRADGSIYNGVTNRKITERERLTWGNSLSFTMEAGQHALAMVSNIDCVMIWKSGGDMSFARIYGSELQVTASGNKITLKYANNRNFTANVIIT